MADLLILRLEGPLQSWGMRARWDVRDSSTEPTKSGVIGLLGAAMGFSKYSPELEDLDAELKMATRTDFPGRLMVDFHTVTGMLPTAQRKIKGKPDDPATIISPSCTRFAKVASRSSRQWGANSSL